MLLGLVMEAHGQASHVPGEEWRQLASPLQAGWSAEKLAKIHEAVEEMGSTSVMIVQHVLLISA